MGCRQGYSLLKRAQRRNVYRDIWRTLRLCVVDTTAPIRGVWCSVAGHIEQVNIYEHTSQGNPVWCFRCQKSLGWRREGE